MKTFSEAAQMFFRKGAPGKPVSGDPVAMAEMIAHQRRYRDIGQEIADSEEIEPLLCALIEGHQHGVPIEYILTNAFILGVKVGMEMERGEPPIAEASVAGRREAAGYTGI